MSAWATMLAVVVGWVIAQSAMEFQSRRPKPDKTLFPLPPATGNLTDRQATVLTMLQAEPQGMRALDIGIALHQADKCAYCSPTSACKYAHTNATAILKALRKKGLAIHRKSGLWQPRVRAAEPAGEIPY